MPVDFFFNWVDSLNWLRDPNSDGIGPVSWLSSKASIVKFTATTISGIDPVNLLNGNANVESDDRFNKSIGIVPVNRLSAKLTDTIYHQSTVRQIKHVSSVTSNNMLSWMIFGVHTYQVAWKQVLVALVP